MKVSIICTNYNKGKWIAEAIDSFLMQKTDFPFEIILVDDASTDGSQEIIKNYQEQYPEKIRAFFNEVNKGIARTWIDSCRLAKGDYIARCDGDDYWTDEYKLQKQIQLLESSSDSKWCNSDFDYVTSEGEIIYESAIQNQIIPFITDLESLIAQKGMTMSSTWVVEHRLMNEVNSVIDVNTIDDTFDLQIELFKRTNLTFLESSTTVYRMSENSDSRPTDNHSFNRRIEQLLDTQLKYINSIGNLDYKKMAQILVERDAVQEKRINSYVSNQKDLENQINYLKIRDGELSVALDELSVREKELKHLITNLKEKELELELIKCSRSWKLRMFIVNLLKRKRND